MHRLRLLTARRQTRAALGLAVVLVLIPGVRAQQATVQKLRTANRVYVPVSELDTVLDGDGQGVLLPQADFQALLDVAAKQGPTPHDMRLSAVRYEATVEGSQLILEATADFEQFQPGWHTLQITTGGLAIESATLDGAEPAMGRKKAGEATLLSNTAGKHSLKLRLSTPLASVGSDLAASFQLLTCPSATVRLTLPAGKQLEVDGVLIDRPAEPDQPATYEFPAGGRKQLQLRITDRRRSARSSALVFMSTAYGINVAPSEITWQAVTNLQSFGEPLDRFVFQVPRALEIAAVESTGLESWELADNEDGTRTEISLTFRQPVDGSRRITFRGVMAVPVNQQWSVPALRLGNAASQVGRILVRHPVGTRLIIEGMDGVRRTTDGKAEPEISRASFDIWQPDFDLRLRLQLREREVLASLSTVVDVQEHAVRFETLATLECLNAPLFEVVASFPAGWEVTGITLDGTPSAWQTIPREAGRVFVRVPFPESLQPGGERQLRLAATQALDVESAAATFALPEVVVETAGVAEGVLLVRAPEWLQLTPVETSGLDPTVIPNISDRHLAFRYQDSRFSGTLQAAPRPPRLAAQTLSFTRLDPDKAATWMEVQLNAEGGGLREVVVSLPDVAGTDLRFRIVRNCTPPVRIREQVVQGMENGRRNWLVRFDRRVRGVLTLGVPLESSRDDQPVSVPHPILPAADRQHGFTAIEASAEQHLILSADAGAALQDVDPADLPPTGYIPRERIVAAYRYVRPGVSLTVAEERFDRGAVPTAICRHMKIDTVLGSTGDLRHHARATVVAVGVQNLRLSFGEDTTLWSTRVDGQPIEVRRDADAYLIPLRPAERPDQRRLVEFVYAGETNPLQVFGTLRQSAPQLSADAAGQTQPVETLKRTWLLHHPDGTLFTASRGRFQPTHPLDRQSMLARLPQLLALPQSRDSAGKLVAIVFVLILALGLRILLRLRTRQRRLAIGAGCLVVLVAVAASLMLLLGSPAMRSAKESVQMDAAPRRAGTAVDSTDDYMLEMAEGSERMDFEAVPQTQSATPEPQLANELAAAPGESAQEAPDRQLVDTAKSDHDGKRMFGRRQLTSGARLSVPVELQLAESSATTEFAYDGTGTTQDIDLDLAYHDQELSTVMELAIIVFVAMCCWWMRRRRLSFRVVLITCGLLIPLGVAPLLSGVWQMAADAIFAGSVAGLGLWLIYGLAGCVRRLPWTRRSLSHAAGIALVLSASQAVAQQQDAAPQPSTDPHLIVPYAEDSLPLMADRIFLPHDQFLQLWRAAHPEKAFAHAPTDGLVSSATYNVRLVRDAQDARSGHMAVTARFLVHSFREEQIRVLLPIPSVAITKATLNGQPAPLATSEIADTTKVRKNQPQQTPPPQSGLSVLLNEPGPAVLDVEFVIPARLTGPAGRFVLPLAPVATGIMRFELPGEELQLRVNGSSTSWRLDAARTVTFPVSADGQTTVEWQPRDEDSGVDRVVHTEVTTAAVFGNAGLRTVTRLLYRVRQGTLSEVTFRLPVNAVLQDVSGDDVGGWQVDAEQHRVRVFLRRAVDAETTISVRMFNSLTVSTTPLPINIPHVEPTEVTRETGFLGVFSDDDIVVRPGEVAGGTQIPAATFPVPARAGLEKRQPVLAWRYSTRPFAVAVTAQRPVAQLRAQAEHAVYVERRRLRSTSRFRITLTGAPRARLAFVLPQDFLPLEVDATGIRDWYPYDDESGARLLIVELAAPALGPVELNISGTQTRNVDGDRVAIPVPNLNDATTASARLAVRIDPSYTASVASANDWKSISPNLVPADVRQLSPVPIRFAFSTSKLSPAPVVVKLGEVSPTVFGESVSVINLTDTSVEYTLNFKWIVRQSATDRFAFSAPDWLAGKLEFRAPGLRQVIESPPADGRVTWTLVLQQPRSSDYFAMALATFPAMIDGNLQTPVLHFEPGTAQAEPVQIQNHYAVVINQSARLITPVAAPLQAARREELRIRIPEEYLNRATQIVVVKAESPPTWSVSTPELQTAAPASVNLADLTTVVAADGSWRTRAVYTIRNRSRQFLPLRLPPKTQLLSVFVRNRPARPVMTSRNQEPLHLIALPRTSETDLAFDVEVVIAGALSKRNLNRALTMVGRDIRLPVPDVPGTREDPEFGIPVAMTVWRVHLPAAWHARIVRRPGQTNVTEVAAEQTEVIRVMSSLKEAVEQSVTFSKDARVSQKLRAFRNLRNYQEEIERRSGKVQDAEVGQNLSLLRGNLFELEKQLSQEGLGAALQDGNTLTIQSDADDAQRGFVSRFNDAILQGNSAQGVTAGPVEEFKLELGLQDKSRTISGKKGAATPSRNRTQSRSVRNLGDQLGDYKSAPGQRDGNGVWDELPAPSKQAPAFRGGQAGGGFGSGGEGFSGLTPGNDMRSAQPDFQTMQEQQFNAPMAGVPIIVQQPADGGLQSAAAAEPVSGLASPQAEAAVSEAGGLSLPVDLSADTPPLSFSKVGGTPLLTLRIRPDDTVRKAWGLGWAALWVSAAGVVLVIVGRRGLRALWGFLFQLCAVAGLLGFVFLPAQFSATTFVIFLVGTLGIVWRQNASHAAGSSGR